MKNSIELARDSISCVEGLPPQIVEKLFQTKQERTFSSLLANELSTQFQSRGFNALIEIKGKSFKRNESDAKETENSHDIVLMDSSAEFLMLVECKVWYHFDGLKGKEATVNPNIVTALREDIRKLRVTINDKKTSLRGFIVIYLITPKEIESIPTSYRPSHLSSLKKSAGDSDQMRIDSIRQVLKVISDQFPELKDVKHLKSEKHQSDQIALDVICAEV